MKLRDRLYKQNRQFQIPQGMLEATMQAYTLQRNKVIALIRSEKRKYIEQLTQQGLRDSKRMWQAMNIIFRKGKSRKKDEITELVSSDNTTIVKEKTQILETLNEYFIEVGENIQEQLKTDFYSKPKQPIVMNETNASIYLYKTNYNELKKIIDSLKTNAASVQKT